MIKIAFGKEYHHELPVNHRFPMEKYTLIPEQLMYEGSFSGENFFEPPTIDKSALLAVHDDEYIRKLDNGLLQRKEERRIGFPWSKSLIKREEIITSGTLQGALFALENGVAFNVAGGTHHAYRDRGEGFCIYNDIAVAAQYLLDNKKSRKVLVVDLDVHQGNGTAKIFERESRVFTFSMHGATNYPLHKEQSDLDISLSADISDLDYLHLLKKNYYYLVEKVKPDVIFYQSGVDILENDRLGKLSITKSGVRERDIIVLEKAHRHQIPVMTSMGGGYARHIRNIVDAHCNTYRVAKEIYD